MQNLLKLSDMLYDEKVELQRYLINENIGIDLVGRMVLLCD
jgi:hypothetical protein